MSTAYWAFWAIFTVVNAVILAGSWWLARSAERLLSDAQVHLNDSKALLQRVLR